MRYEFDVWEAPIPKPRPRASGHGGHVRVFTPRTAERAEDAIAERARGLRGDADVISGALRVSVVAYLRRPISAPRRIKYPVKKPDIDNFAKLVLDGLSRSGIFVDDSQVVDLSISKRFHEDPHWHITLQTIEDDD